MSFPFLSGLIFSLPLSFGTTNPERTLMIFFLPTVESGFLSSRTPMDRFFPPFQGFPFRSSFFYRRICFAVLFTPCKEPCPIPSIDALLGSWTQFSSTRIACCAQPANLSLPSTQKGNDFRILSFPPRGFFYARVGASLSCFLRGRASPCKGVTSIWI